MDHKIPIDSVKPLHKAPEQSEVDKAVKLHTDLRAILSSGYETILQGSYKNDTCLPGINDVDIVAIRKTTYSGVYSPSPAEPRPPISWETIFSEIETLIKNSTFAARLLPHGDKCVKIGGVLNADITPAVIYSEADHDPVIIYSFREASERLNYPRVHYKNGVDKQAATNDLYKPTVRMFKKWRDRHFADSKVAPSFHIESAVHSVDNENFHPDMAITFILVGSEITKKMRDNTPIPSVSGHENVLDRWSLVNRQLFRMKLEECIGYALEAIRESSEAGAKTKWNKAFNL